MEWVADLETGSQKLARLRLGRGRIYGGPLGRELRAPFKAPVPERRTNVLPDLVTPKVLKEPTPHDLADLRLVVGNQVLGDATHHFRDFVLPLLVRRRHLDLAARQADDRRPVRGPGGGDRQVLDKGVE